jgi:hypothetical protein
LKSACALAGLAGIVNVHWFELPEHAPVQLLKVYPEPAVAVSVIDAPDMKLPVEHPGELVGEADTEEPAEPSVVSVSG